MGSYGDTSGYHGFLYDGTTWTSLDYPGSTETVAWGITSGNITGTYTDASGQHGFLYDGTTWTSLDYPGAVWTAAADFDAGNIVGG